MSASGPLDPGDPDAFERRYGVPVLLAYGATEFAGSVCTWTPELYREFGAVKPDSSGRVLPDTEVRIIDPETGEPVPTDHRGLLEAKIATVGPDWIRTNDLASVDADGFITLHGRADGRSTAGGFKGAAGSGSARAGFTSRGSGRRRGRRARRPARVRFRSPPSRRFPDARCRPRPS